MFLSVDDSAKSAFLSGCSDSSTLYLQYQIRDEAFVKVGTGKTPAGSASSVKACFEEIRKGMEQKKNEPTFIVARNISQESGDKVRTRRGEGKRGRGNHI